MEFDIFIGHAWRFHEEWRLLSEELDSLPDFRWRNFSVPWHDPAFSANSEEGGRRIRRWLEAQVSPAHIVVMTDGIWKTRSARPWIEREIALARQHGKQVIAMKSNGRDDIDQDLGDLADIVIEWGASCLRDLLETRGTLDAAASTNSKSALATNHRGIPDGHDPRQWRLHRFALPAERWKTLGGRAFWITGAGTGYGQAIATALAAADATVFLSGRRRSKLVESIEMIAGLGINVKRCHAVPCDIANPASVTDAIRSISIKAPQLFGLINNAALGPCGATSPLQTNSWESWEAMIRTNLTGGWLCARAALPLMIPEASLRILFISSGAGWASTPGAGPYNVSKAALNSLSMSLAAEIERDHPHCDCQINALDPGESLTEMNRGSTESAFAVVPAVLALLSHPSGGPNGRFFHRSGTSRGFCNAEAWPRPLLEARISPEIEPDRRCSVGECL